MKVIDLLNKIANGEEFPNIIKYKDIVFDYKKEKGDYESEGEQFFLDWVELNKYGLNDDVRAIELCHKCHKYPAEYNQTYCEFCLGISEEDKKIERLENIIKEVREYLDIDEIIRKNCKRYDVNGIAILEILDKTN